MDRNTLEAIWRETHPDLGSDSPLHAAIITEGFEAGEGDAQATVAGLYRLAQDIEDFANAVTERAQGLTALAAVRPAEAGKLVEGTGTADKPPRYARR